MTKTLQNLLQSSDDYAKIFTIVWIKLRDLYLDPYDSSISSIQSKISLATRVKKTVKFIRNVRKQCIKSNKLHNLARLLHYIEGELKEGNKFIEKIQQFSLLASMFDLPEPIKEIIETLGLNNAEDNEFANEINNLFDNIDDEAIEKNLNNLEETLNEGTLANFLKNKDASIQESNKLLDKRDVKLEFKKPETIPEKKKVNINKNLFPQEPPKSLPHFLQKTNKLPPIIEAPQYTPNNKISTNFPRKPLVLTPIIRYNSITPNPRTSFRR